MKCKGCNRRTCECPDGFPPEWKGFCPQCAIAKMFAGELPECDPEKLVGLVVGSAILALVEIDVNNNNDTSDMDIAFTGSGQLMRYHSKDKCEGHPCPMHAPSDHHMVTWPMHGRSDLELPLVERICPHKATHPDPDSLAWALRHDPDFEPYHGACDGCCKGT